MDNFTISDYDISDRSIFEVKEGSTLSLRNGMIERNQGNASLIHVSENSSLELYDMKFIGNSSKEWPICLTGTDIKSLKIKRCHFKDHHKLEE